MSADEDRRLDLIDRLPKDMVIWDDDDEVPAFADRDLSWWLKVLGHDRAHTACCTACGCATTCMAGLFYESVVMSVVRELDKLGALNHDTPTP